MDKRRLGTSPLMVSAIGLGCFSMSGGYGPSDEAEAIATIHRAIEIGVDFLDTADRYGAGHNESLIGRALAGRRGDVVLATKFGALPTEFNETLKVNGRPDYVPRAVDASLKRLGTDYIDLYYLHRVDPDVPIEDSVGAMAKLVEAGKIRHIGLCEAAPATLRRAAAIHPIAALQSEFALWTRDPEAEILPICRELGIGFVPYSPLGRGFLGGRIAASDAIAAGDKRMGLPRFEAENVARNLAHIEALKKIAAGKDCTLAQLALAWLLHQGPDIVPIPGTKRRGYLEENAAAADIPLDADDLAHIESIAPLGAFAGARKPAATMASANL